MANTNVNGERYSYIQVTEAPPADGSWCNSVSMSAKNASPLFFSRRGGGSANIAIQFKTPETGSEWTDYEHDLTLDDGVRCILEDQGHGVKWRAGVKSGGWSSGTVIIGFDW